MKKIINIIIMAAIMLTVSATAYAQNQQRQRMTREQLAELQARRIAENMAFDDQTSARFINTYCRCQKEIWALGPRAGRNHNKQNAESMTDEQAEQAIKDRFAQSQKILSIRQKYYAEYSKFLSQKQIERVYQLEKQMMGRLANRGNHGKMRHHSK